MKLARTDHGKLPPPELSRRVAHRSDTNKRTAYVALETCFALIGLRFPVSDAEAVAKPLAMASGEILDAKFTDWVHANIASAGKADSPGGRSVGGTTRAGRPGPVGSFKRYGIQPKFPCRCNPSAEQSRRGR